LKRPSLFLFVAFTSSVAFLLGLVVAGSRPDGAARSMLAAPARTDAHPLTVSVGPAVEAPAGAGVDFSVVAARLKPSVVHVDCAARGRDRPAPSRPFPRNRDGDDDNGPREQTGSGFIIDRSGYILTNHHVIEGADRVTITLGDGRVFRANVVGADPAIDVALLQIPAASDLPVAPIGNSDGLRVGEWVCAIGNPLGYVHSVTVGVVSFLGRKLFDPSLDDFIQTDAAISFGNSGGPLINSRGEVVGITTAISSQASNIGFAIPITQVMGVLSQLKERGGVSRGYLGVSLTNATPALLKSLRLSPARGALVEDISPDTPADRAGMRVYDLITAVDGRLIRSDEELIRYIAGQVPGSVSRLTVWRDGASQVMHVRLAERPLPRSAHRLPAGSGGVSAVSNQEQAPLGLSVKSIDAATVRRLNLPDALVGVLVTDVDPAGPARLARIRPGQVLLEINRHRIGSLADFQGVVATLRPGDNAALLVYDRLSDQRALSAIAIDPQ
jgi:serine protease Do